MLECSSHTIHECQISPLTVRKRQAQCSPSDHKAIDEEVVLLAWIRLEVGGTVYCVCRYQIVCWPAALPGHTGHVQCLAGSVGRHLHQSPDKHTLIPPARGGVSEAHARTHLPIPWPASVIPACTLPPSVLPLLV